MLKKGSDCYAFSMFILKLIISISQFLRYGKQSVSCTFFSSNRTKLLLVYFYSFIHILNTINMWSCEIIYRIQLRGKISCLYYLVYLQVGRSWKNNTDDNELSVKKIIKWGSYQNRLEGHLSTVVQSCTLGWGYRKSARIRLHTYNL